MTNPAAFKATLVDFKNIRTRKLVQIVFEAPIEDADRILAGLGGYGTLGKESWWAVARLDAEPASEPVKPEKRRRLWDELSYAEQAGIRCGEESFKRWALEAKFAHPNTDIAEVVRRYCRVSTRAEIRQGNAAGTRWEFLESNYQSWLKAAEHVA